MALTSHNAVSLEFDATPQFQTHGPHEEQRGRKKSGSFLLDPNGPKLRKSNQGRISKCMKSRRMLVDVAGIEPATPCLQSARVVSNDCLAHFNC